MEKFVEESSENRNIKSSDEFRFSVPEELCVHLY